MPLTYASNKQFVGTTGRLSSWWARAKHFHCARFLHGLQHFLHSQLHWQWDCSNVIRWRLPAHLQYLPHEFITYCIFLQRETHNPSLTWGTANTNFYVIEWKFKYQILHNHPLYLVCPDVLSTVCETSYGIQVGSIESDIVFIILLFICLFVSEEQSLLLSS